MAGIQLYNHQLDAIEHMKNGCILNGGVGTGKSRTALGYFYKEQGGVLNSKRYTPMKDPKDLYIITTARKRDTQDWDAEMMPFLLSTDVETNAYKNTVVVDSWNNISKYTDVKGAFFIFDEQRVVGSGVWVQAFLKIAKSNDWILLSATPGDTWMDYIPVFIANGFYKNRSEFIREHVVYRRFVKFPQVERYINTGRLIRLRNSILVDMEFHRRTVAHHIDVIVDYDISTYKLTGKTRQDPYKERPIKSAGELCLVWRKIVNSDESRAKAVLDLCETHPRTIIFYNFDYELDILRKLRYPKGTIVAEWNGHVHSPVPENDRWVYLVQYTAGCEGWNCVRTDTIIFYSQSYSYKVMEQAAGRIDRLNTAYKDLYYYHIRSNASIDVAIYKALKSKKAFNEGRFIKSII